VEITYERLRVTDAEELVDFLSGDTWPFHGSTVVDEAEVRGGITEGRYDSEDNRALWIMIAGERTGLVRLMDLGDDTPLSICGSGPSTEGRASADRP
jgi:hypothetical protein